MSTVCFHSYLDLLGTFRKLVGLKKTELQSARNRTKIGLDKVRIIISSILNAHQLVHVLHCVKTFIYFI